MVPGFKLSSRRTALIGTGHNERVTTMKKATPVETALNQMDKEISFLCNTRVSALREIPDVVYRLRMAKSEIDVIIRALIGTAVA
jgi:hypothetical protein